MNKKSLMIAALGMGLAFAGSNALADKHVKCDPKAENCFCHNIGGPMELGANCDASGCTFDYYDSGGTMQSLTVPEGYFLGIIIGVTQDSNENAVAAHIAHGDGYATVVYDPPLHLASQGLNHRAANVECLAERIVTHRDQGGDDTGN